ncbi:hypothetical protein TRFO_00956 [Tritrichomonas foetus]|uniref:Cilia- and flagella-associated protein 36 n=1 Tax=Tritrichomonas foetus TaxID=1144522 RepID=A0A1J4L2C1_9EUKA|nr:hypothetical protein TRFO_00956 [Tritrichomonas foetus]|eukprot:OHT17663.1 hypothetical protein TRFO_00956 [Tritrichomonas foetus]
MYVGLYVNEIKKMSKFQKDRDIFFGICKFFSSNAWWRPIIEFIYSNCKEFLNSLEYSTEEEHQVYIKFMDLVSDLVDNFMCSKLHITPDAFENLMSRFITKPNDKATVIFDTLRQATDYNEFCKQMHQCNVRIENSITRALLKFADDESITSTEELAKKVAQAIEEDQNQEIKELVHKGCVQMKKLMGISVLSPSIKKLNKQNLQGDEKQKSRDSHHRHHHHHHKSHEELVENNPKSGNGRIKQNVESENNNVVIKSLKTTNTNNNVNNHLHHNARAGDSSDSTTSSTSPENIRKNSVKLAINPIDIVIDESDSNEEEEDDEVQVCLSTLKSTTSISSMRGIKHIQPLRKSFAQKRPSCIKEALIEKKETPAKNRIHVVFDSP